MSGLVDKQASGVLKWKVSCFGKDLLEFFVGKLSRLFEGVHGLTDFHVDVAVRGDNDIEVILFNDMLRDVRQFLSHVFILVKWSVQIHIADVHGHIPGALSRNNAVEVHFECLKACCFGTDITRVIEDEVVSTGDLGPICFLFLWSDCTDNSGIRNCTANWYLRFWDEEKRVCAVLGLGGRVHWHMIDPSLSCSGGRRLRGDIPSIAQ